MTAVQHFYYSALFTSITTLFLGIFVYLARPTSNVNRVFTLYSFSISVWSICVYYHGSAQTSLESLFWGKALNFGAILIPILFYNFILIYLDKIHEKKHFIRLILAYLLGVAFQILNLTDLFVPTVRKAPPLNYLMVAGPCYHFFVIFFFSLTVYSIILLYDELQKSQGVKRTQLIYFVLSSSVGYLGGVDNFYILYDIHLPIVFPLGSYAVPIYVGVATFIILKYRFMDIEVIIRRTLVFAGLFSFAFGVFAFTTFLTQELLKAYVTGTGGRILSLGVSVFLIVLVYDPLRRFLINLTDRFLFQKKYDYRKFLRDASAGISQIKSLHQLLSLVIHFVTMRIRVKNAAILIHDEKRNCFRLAYMRGYLKPLTLSLSPEGRGEKGGESFPRGRGKKDEGKNRLFNENDPLINYLAREQAPLDLERVKEYAETGGPKKTKDQRQRTYDFKAIQARMEELQAACCVPSYLGERLRNVLILGEKRSGDFYSDEDLNVLYTLAQESAIAIENARLYDQAIEKAKELEAINEQLNTAQSNLLHALDETEVANKKLRDTHAQLIHEQKMATLGRLASSVGHEVNNPLTILSMNVSRAILKHRNNPDLKVRDVLDIFQKMEQNISRIKAVVNTLTGLLKKSEHGKFEALSLKLVLEETLPLVQFQTYLDNLSGTEVTFDIPSGLPLIKGDLERLQEVFLNLFINAYHAMAGRRDRKILVTAHESPAHPAMMLIEFSDNGAGMTDDVMKKAFSYGFTTKPAGKGSGMGLYMCRYIIELHGGEVKVRSKPGEGTTFAITLPIYYEPTSSIASDESATP